MFAVCYVVVFVALLLVLRVGLFGYLCWLCSCCVALSCVSVFVCLLVYVIVCFFVVGLSCVCLPSSVCFVLWFVRYGCDCC